MHPARRVLICLETKWCACSSCRHTRVAIAWPMDECVAIALADRSTVVVARRFIIPATRRASSLDIRVVVFVGLSAPRGT